MASAILSKDLGAFAPDCRSFWVTVERPTSALCKLASRSRNMENRCVCDSLEFIKGYVFPPLNLIGNCLHKLKEDRAPLTMVCSYWPSQPLYPLLLKMEMDIPLVLPAHPYLLQSKCEGHSLTQYNALCLVAWRLSGCTTEASAFRKRLSNLYWPAKYLPPMLCTKPPETNGVVGVVGTTLIPCKVLWTIS